MAAEPNSNSPNKHGYRAIVDTLSEIRVILARAYPQIKSATWYERAYERFRQLVKYVGIPGLLIGTIIPIYNLTEAAIQFRNNQIIRRVYEEYSFNLMRSGAVDRAKFILDQIDILDRLDVRTQYLRARLLTTTAIKQGRDHKKAEDLITVLIILHDKSDFLFPKLGGAQEIISLQIDLADIYIQLQNYSGAVELLDKLQSKLNSNIDRGDISVADIHLRRGMISLLTHKYLDAEKQLKMSVSVLEKQQKSEALAEAYFQLGKTYQFSSDHRTALAFYSKSQQLWEQLNDKYGLVKVLNNTAMIYDRQERDAEAKILYDREVSLARELKDDRSLARALVNLAGMETASGNHEKAIGLALEAEEAFGRETNLLGLATAYGTLSRAYQKLNQISKVIYYLQKAMALYIETKEIKSLAQVMRDLSQVYRKIKNDAEFYYHGLAAYELFKYSYADQVATFRTEMVTLLNYLRTYRPRATVGAMIEKSRVRILELTKTLDLREFRFTISEDMLFHNRPEESMSYLDVRARARLTCFASKSKVGSSSASGIV